MHNKQFVEVEVETFHIEDMDELTLDEGVEFMKKFTNRISKDFTDCKFKLSYEYNEGQLKVFGKREETDKEIKERLVMEEQTRAKEAKKIERERAQYEKLKAKFENKTT